MYHMCVLNYDVKLVNKSQPPRPTSDGLCSQLFKDRRNKSAHKTEKAS